MALEATIVRDLAGYRMSRDYEQLWHLAQVQSVVCVVDYSFHGEDMVPSRDVAHTIHAKGSGEVSVSARGIGYAGGYDGMKRFVSDAEAVNLEWLVPDGVEAIKEGPDGEP